MPYFFVIYANVLYLNKLSDANRYFDTLHINCNIYMLIIAKDAAFSQTQNVVLSVILSEID